MQQQFVCCRKHQHGCNWSLYRAYFYWSSKVVVLFFAASVRSRIRGSTFERKTLCLPEFNLLEKEQQQHHTLGLQNSVNSRPCVISSSCSSSSSLHVGHRACQHCKLGTSQWQWAKTHHRPTGKEQEEKKMRGQRKSRAVCQDKSCKTRVEQNSAGAN